MGVTRVARVTGLDRTGVEVACAVRPGGHVLQVCNGKGLTYSDASWGALLETAELWAAETVMPGRLVWGSRAELDGRLGSLWGAESLGSAGALVAPRLWSDGVRCAWREATDLFSGRSVWVPAQGIHVPPPDGPALGPVAAAWTSNGSGAHPDAGQALLHALLEATERDQLSRTLPEGWTEDVVRQRLLRPSELHEAAPRAAVLAESLKEQGFGVYLFDATPSKRTPGAVGLPVGAAVLVDLEEGPVPLTAGYACALGRDEALLKALLEAAQSRLTDIHGAREDVASSDREAARGFADACAQVRPRRRAGDMPDLGAHAKEASARKVRRVLTLLKRAGFSRAASVELDSPVSGLHVRRVVVPGMRISELL
ncbi:YcaO-like family protein [Pyxidicoccus parkwayensis]|uniref:YcaO-like family protein n=1 Tax=Pyxidicoccus parkwayensis TaxID=2813578 RepID=A0ABX7NJZ2_9BACT|nr:YcaO-like family protein [Pyxidicoccus parkwaysis]QSQ18733.1 YcaO-like family protein [Pyxidicoccus parkwaysis]